MFLMYAPHALNKWSESTSVLPGRQRKTAAGLMVGCALFMPLPTFSPTSYQALPSSRTQETEGSLVLEVTGRCGRPGLHDCELSRQLVHASRTLS